MGCSLCPDFVLTGEKWFCSAAGAAKQAIITAQTETGNQMLVVALTPSVQVTDRGVKLAGMRAATTGSVDLTGVVGDEDALIGEAWRLSARAHILYRGLA